MSINLNTALYHASGVDVNNVAKVSSLILNSAQNNTQNIPQVQSIDYSKFNRASLGVDLYSAKTSVELQKQIAMTQAGLYSQAVNIAKLNSQAAQNLYSASTVQKQVELTQSIAEGAQLTPVKKLENPNSKIELFNISDKNSNSHNSFNPFKATEDERAVENEIENSTLFI